MKVLRILSVTAISMVMFAIISVFASPNVSASALHPSVVTNELCHYGGQTYSPGASIETPDGRTIICQSNGSWL